MEIEFDDRSKNLLELDTYNLHPKNQQYLEDISPRPSKKTFVNKEMALKQEISTEPSLESTLERMSKAKVFKEDLKHQKNNVFGLSGSSSRHLRPIQDGKKCLTLIQKLKKKMNEQPFLFSAIADTKTINPMDITTVEKNLKTGVYLSPLDFAEDVRKILRSGMRSADNNPAALIRAQEISGYFEENFKEIENEIWNHAPKAQYRKSAKKSKVINFQQSAGKTAPAIRKTQKPTAAKSEMNISEDKQQFCEMIGRTPTENQRDAIQVVSDQASDSQNKSEVLEFGNAAISTDRMPELQSCVVPKFELVNNDQEEHENERNNIFDNSDPVQEVSNHAQFSISPKKITDVKSQSVNVRLDPTTNKNSNSDDSDSSFITDSDDSDDERNNKRIHKISQPVNEHAIANFQAGEYGSMLGAYIISDKRR